MYTYTYVYIYIYIYDNTNSNSNNNNNNNNKRKSKECRRRAIRRCPKTCDGDTLLQVLIFNEELFLVTDERTIKHLNQT